jgi:hypothetical protein
MFSLIASTKPSMFIHVPFDLYRRDVGDQVKASSAGGIATTTASKHGLQLTCKCLL